MKIYKNKIINIGELIPYANNSRTHSDEQVIQIASSIKEFGFTNPILIDESGGVIAGHGRILAAKKLSFDELPCIVLDGLTEAQKKAYVIADNQLALNSGWDMEMLKVEIEGLKELDFDVELLGFDDEFIKELNLSMDDLEQRSSINEYTKKIKSPVYEPTGEKPDISELFDTSKCDNLTNEINASDIPGKEKEFLITSAQRHVVFNYRNIAEYYSHSSKELQELMEYSALVIIDFNKAIENGFVKMSDELAKIYINDNEK